jgi:hypothetical protein
MKNTILIFSACMLILYCAVLEGTETRIVTLGSESDLVIDDTNIGRYPSGMERFAERCIFEYGFYPYSDSLAYFGFYKEIGKFGNIGIVANRTGIPPFPETSSQTLIAQPDAVVHLFYSLRFKDAVSLGIGGGYGIAAMNDDEEGTANDVTDESSVTSGRASLTYAFGASESFVELAGGIQTYSFTFKQGDNFSFENDNSMSTSYNFRLFYNLNDYASFIPYAAYNTLDLGSHEVSGAATSDVKRLQTATKAGVGFNLAPFEENRIIMGIAYRQIVSQVADAVSDSVLTERHMPEFSGGIESQVRSWLVVRAGMKKSLCVQTVERQNGIRSEFTYKSAPFVLHVGCGLRFGPLEFDGVVHNEFRYTGGYLLSGEENPLFTMVSATYRF